MSLDVESVLAWTEKHRGQKILIFGFTFMVWKHFIKILEINQLQFPEGILVHSGGWKKLQEEAVDNGEFKRVVKERTGLIAVHNFYGMVEQIGSVFVECEHARLHCPDFADVIARDPLTFAPAPIGQEGVLEVLSLLPQSYPGHALLTEDLGTIAGVDDCPCGRLGKHFTIKGRIPRAELRGCSDTVTS
jgi:hypothetical protein